MQKDDLLDSSYAWLLLTSRNYTKFARFEETFCYIFAAFPWFEYPTRPHLHFLWKLYDFRFDLFSRLTVMYLINVQSSKKNKRTGWKISSISVFFFRKHIHTRSHLLSRLYCFFIIFSLDRHFANLNWQFIVSNFVGFLEIEVSSKLWQFSKVLNVKN